MNISVGQLRKYRFSFSRGISDSGIALFDLVGTFVVAFIVAKLFSIPEKYTRVFYLSLIPFGIVIHLLVKQPTFLNTNLFSPNLDINSISIKSIVILIVILFYLNFKTFKTSVDQNVK